MSTLDSKKYKEAERQSWDSVANNWQKWWKTIERGAEKVSRRLIELAAIKRGSKVLDIATGIGEPAITAANQVGNSGHSNIYRSLIEGGQFQLRFGLRQFKIL